MNEYTRREKMAEEYRKTHPPGTRIVLLSTSEVDQPVPIGMRGTVDHIDDQSQLWMRWDNGRTLPVVPEEDSFRKLTDEELAQEQVPSRKVVRFGDECQISIPTEPIKCSKLGYFDELEYDCWDLVKKYCEKFGIEIKSGDISFDIAKGVQDNIIEKFMEAGVKFEFNDDITEGEAPVLGM